MNTNPKVGYNVFKLVLPLLTNQELLVANTELQVQIMQWGGIRLMVGYGNSIKTRYDAYYTLSNDKKQIYTFFKAPKMTLPKVMEAEYFVLPCRMIDYDLHVTDKALDLEMGACYSASELTANLNQKKAKILTGYSSEKIFAVSF